MAELAANRYATALFELAMETGRLELFDDEVRLVYDTLKNSSEFLEVLNHPRISGDEKFKILEDAFKGKVSDDILGLFSIVLKKNRESELTDILRLFGLMAMKQKGIVDCYVYSAHALTDEQIKEINVKMSEKLNKQVNIHSAIDESLIGGIVIKACGYVFDASIKTQLNELKKQLLNIQLA